MTNDIQWEIVFGQFLNRAKTECKAIFRIPSTPIGQPAKLKR
jgi:hypothetical protein